MGNIPGSRFDIMGASGTQGLLGSMPSWRAYVLPRGGYASQASTGVTITFDTSSVASRFATNQWIQAGLSTANIRQVSGVGGNSITISGANLTVAKNDRIFLIGNTQPTVTGGSATYTTPASFIYQRDDDTADLYTNSMITSDSNGLIQFFASPGQFDVIIQDGNQSNQGSIVDLPVGADGVSTASNAYFGASVTIAGALGVTGWATFGVTTTIGGALGVTGWATFGSTVTMNAQLGVTGTATFGSTVVVNGWATFGSTVTLSGTLGVTNGIIAQGGLSVTTGIFGVSNQPRCVLYNPIGAAGYSLTTGVSQTISWTSELFDVGNLHGGTSSKIIIPAGYGGFYHILAVANIPTAAGAGGEDRKLFVQKNTAMTVGQQSTNLSSSGAIQDLEVSVYDQAIAGDFYEMVVYHTHGGSVTINGSTSGQSRFCAVKFF